MGRTACMEPQCLHKGALYLTSVPVQGCTLPFTLWNRLISAMYVDKMEYSKDDMFVIYLIFRF